jgi:hypothetical protein
MGYGASCDCKLPTREGEPIIGYWVAKPCDGKCGFIPTGEECYDGSQYMGEGRPIRVLRLEL